MFATGAGFASEAIKGINILKSGSDPEVKPDEQYPQWVWQVGSPGKMLSQLNREQEDPEQETTMEEVSAVVGPDSTTADGAMCSCSLPRLPGDANLKRLTQRLSTLQRPLASAQTMVHIQAC